MTSTDKTTGLGTGRCLCSKQIPKGDNWCGDECYLPWLKLRTLTPDTETPDKTSDMRMGGISQSREPVAFCSVCTLPMPVGGRGPKKRFCSDSCRKKVSRHVPSS